MNSVRMFQLGASLLVVQAALTYGLSKAEYLPSPSPLEGFPRTFADWPQAQDGVLEPEVYEMLSPDDVLNRSYWKPKSQANVQLFVAYYKTQLRAKNAHDPKVCLPGGGWVPKASQVIDLPLNTGTSPARVNYYWVAKGDSQIVVLYWYQTHKRVIAQEQILRFYRLLDNIADNRTDMALVRIVSPAIDGDVNGASDRAKQFAQEVYPHLVLQFPPKS